MNKEAILKFKELLRQTQTELRIINPKTKEIKSFFVEDDLDWKKYCQTFNGKCNIYAGVNERFLNGTKAEDVLYVKIIPIDIDCKNKPSTKEDLEEAKKVAEQIIEDGQQAGYQIPFMVMSGNGYQLFYALEGIEITNENRREVEEKIQTFERKLKQKYDNDKVELDNVGDLPRIMRVVGTTNLKSGTESKIILDGINIDKKLQGDILNIKPEEKLIISGKLSQEFIDKIKQDEKVWKLFEGNIGKFPSRSEAELSLVSRLIQLNFIKDEIFKVMAFCKLGKWQEAHLQYRELTYTKAMQSIQTKPKEKIRISDKNNIFTKSIEGLHNSIQELKPKVITHLIKKERREATELIVKGIETQKHIYTTREDEKEEVYIYHEGIYIPQGKTFIKEICRVVLGEVYTTNLCNEVIAKIEVDTYIDTEEFFSNNNINEIPVQNGILNLKNRKLKPFDPKKIFFNKLPIKYNPKAKCPNILKHFKTILENEDDIPVMLELFGYLLYKEYKIEKAFMFCGDGRNGKGKTLELMKRFIGHENVSNIPIQQFENDIYSMSELINKMANLAGDISRKALKDTGSFKSLTGRDLISSARKFKTRLNFVNYAKLIFCANELPITYDKTIAFFNRWLIINFPYTFVSQKEYEKIEQKEMFKIADIDIVKKLTTSDELSGLLNRALDSLDKLLKEGDFSYSKTTKDVKDMWIRKSDSFSAFLMDYIKEDYEGKITKQELRKAYALYCRNFKLKILSDRIIRNILTTTFVVEEERDQSLGKRGTYWSGIAFCKSKGNMDNMGFSILGDFAKSRSVVKKVVNPVTLVDIDDKKNTPIICNCKECGLKTNNLNKKGICEYCDKGD